MEVDDHTLSEKKNQEEKIIIFHDEKSFSKNIFEKKSRKFSKKKIEILKFENFQNLTFSPKKNRFFFSKIF